MAKGYCWRMLEGRELTALQGDIVRQQVDVIVNAANAQLCGGGGVDGAIHAAGGPQILAECRQIIARIGLLPPGQAVSTTAGLLSARHVVHTVGPIWMGGYEHEAETLESCYLQSMACADRLGARSIAFPAIATGAYGYPLEEAAAIAVRALARALRASQNLRRVTMALYGRQSFGAFHKALVEASGLSLQPTSSPSGGVKFVPE